MTDFLFGFARALVERLAAEGLLDIADGSQGAVAAYLATYLANLNEGKSLLSSIEHALLACPEVDELYFDLDALKSVVEDLRR